MSENVGVFRTTEDGLEELKAWVQKELTAIYDGDVPEGRIEEVLGKVPVPDELDGKGVWRITIGQTKIPFSGLGSSQHHPYRDPLSHLFSDLDDWTDDGPDCATCEIRPYCSLPKKLAWEASQRSRRTQPHTTHPFGLGDFGASGFEQPTRSGSAATAALATMMMYDELKRRQRLVNRAWRGFKSAVFTFVVAVIILPFFKVLEFWLHAYTWNKQDQHRKECRTARLGARFGRWVSTSWSRRPWANEEIVITDEEVS